MDTTDETVGKSLYTVKTGGFEGPLSLLLELIEKRKLFVNEVSLAAVTDDYIAYVKALPSFDMNHIASFVVVAATLLLIKSRSLLPGFALTKEEEENIVDLESRLSLYKLVKEASIEIKNNFGMQIIFSAPERDTTAPVFSPDPRVTQELLASALTDVIVRLPKPAEILPEVTVAKVVSLEEMIGTLSDRIEHHLSLSFQEFSKNSDPNATEKEKKVYTIVSFLALLELVRGGLVDCLQNDAYADISITKEEIPA